MQLRLTLVLLLLAGLLALAAPKLARAAGAWSPDSGGDPVETIADLQGSRDAFAPGTGDGTGRVTLSFRSTIAQRVRITVLDQLGRDVRTIVDSDIAAGPASYAWDGRTDAGLLAADGSYELVVEAQDRDESLSVSDIVRVDRRAPTLSTTTSRVRLTSLYARSFRLPVVASEAALVELATVSTSGRERATASSPAGRTTLTVPIAAGAGLRRALARGRARVALTMVVNDDAGNRTSRTMPVELLPPLVPGTSTGDDPPAGGASRIIWPISGPITSRFGQRWGRMHNGLDIAAPSGRPIGAAAPGRVTYAGWMSGYGNVVMIDHGSTVTVYAHQLRVATRAGQTVRRGQTIGYVGSTGNSTGPHLHFEVRVGGSARDPLRYLP